MSAEDSFAAALLPWFIDKFINYADHINLKAGELVLKQNNSLINKIESKYAGYSSTMVYLQVNLT